MSYCAERVGSVSALAKKAGISQSGIRRYFNGGEPSRPHLVAIAGAADVSLAWLAAGEGPREGGEAAPTSGLGRPDVDLDALEEVVTRVRTMLRQKQPDLSPKAEARIIRLVYEFLLKQGKTMDEATLDNVIELAAFR